MKLIDTNIFIEMLLGQEKSEIAKATLEFLVENKIPLVITSFTIHSIIVLLENRGLRNACILFLENLQKLQNTIFYYPTIQDEIEILKSSETNKFDFDDSFQIYSAKKFQAEIITFDKDFKILKDISVTIL